jgi:serine/threonine-protein kinase RsbW
MTLEPRFHLGIGSRIENIEIVQVVLRDALERLGVDEDSGHWIDVAVREAVANAIKHGNRLAADKRVAIAVGVEGGDLVVEVEDEGEGFDPERLADPLAPENLVRTSGRGIFFMRRFMDDVRYGSRPGGGTVVTLRKRLSRGSGSEAEGEDLGPKERGEGK